MHGIYPTRYSGDDVACSRPPLHAIDTHIEGHVLNRPRILVNTDQTRLYYTPFCDLASLYRSARYVGG